MKIYIVSLACGLLVGVIYGLLHVRSPAPPVVALVGLLGILLGEQAVPLWHWLTQARTPHHSVTHILGQMPSAHQPRDERPS